MTTITVTISSDRLTAEELAAEIDALLADKIAGYIGDPDDLAGATFSIR